jgi:hypothetical protein
MSFPKRPVTRCRYRKFLQNLMRLCRNSSGMCAAQICAAVQQSFRFFQLRLSDRLTLHNCDGGATRGHRDEAQHAGRRRCVCFCWRDLAGGLLSFSNIVRKSSFRFSGQDRVQTCLAFKRRNHQGPPRQNRRSQVENSGAIVRPGVFVCAISLRGSARGRGPLKRVHFLRGHTPREDL